MQQYVVRACDELHRHNVYLFRRNALHHAGIAALCRVLLPQILDDGGIETARLNRDEQDHIRGSRSTQRRNGAERRGAHPADAFLLVLPPSVRQFLRRRRRRAVARSWPIHMIPDESACLYNGLHAGGMSAPPSQPPSLSQRLTMWQKRSAVRSASYSAECASP